MNQQSSPAFTPSSSPGEMTLWEHLSELRKYGLRAILGIVVCASVSFVYWKEIWVFLATPLRQQGLTVQLINTAPVEAFITSIKVALVAGIVIASPWVSWNLWKFVAPALFSREKKMLVPVFLSSVFLFLGGAAFCFYLVLPYGVKFLANYTLGEVAPHWRQGDYASFVLKVLIAFGLTFELPVLSFVLTRLGLVNAQKLWHFFRYALVIIFIVAALLTPPDPVTQTLLAIPLALIYLLSIGVAKLAEEKQA